MSFYIHRLAIMILFCARFVEMFTGQ